jgi:hypothetical protein
MIPFPYMPSVEQSTGVASHPSTFRLWLQFIAGMLYLAMISLVLSVVLRYTFLSTYASVLGVTLLSSILALVWITRWAERRDSKLGQFGIGSLLFLMLFAAIFCSILRVIIARMDEIERIDESHRLAVIAALGAFIAVVILLSFPLVLHMVESLLKAAVWLIHRPWLRRSVGVLSRRNTSK